MKNYRIREVANGFVIDAEQREGYLMSQDKIWIAESLDDIPDILAADMSIAADGGD